MQLIRHTIAPSGSLADKVRALGIEAWYPLDETAGSTQAHDALGGAAGTYPDAPGASYQQAGPYGPGWAPGWAGMVQIPAAHAPTKSWHALHMAISYAYDEEAFLASQAADGQGRTIWFGSSGNHGVPFTISNGWQQFGPQYAYPGGWFFLTFFLHVSEAWKGLWANGTELGCPYAAYDMSLPMQVAGGGSSAYAHVMRSQADDPNVFINQNQRLSQLLLAH